MEHIICIVLAVLCIVLLVYILAMKKQADNIRAELEATRNENYNRQLRISLFDNNVSQMVSEINRNLDHQKAVKLEAEASKEQLKQSVSDIAHDLRTPLTVIKGNLFMLDKEEGLSKRGRESLRISMEKTDALKEMVDDFFELSVLESDLSAVKLEKIDATAFIAQFVIDNETVIRQHGLNPSLKLPEKSIFIKADEKLLMRMCNNLLNNVLKYAKDEFSVELRNSCFCGVQHQGDVGSAQTEVERMHGAGRWHDNDLYDKKTADKDTVEIIFSNKIAQDMDFDVNMLFDRTYRGDKARPSGGAGLGLYIVKLLAEKQGAKVSADNKDGKLNIIICFS